jgi:hypothetical protein
MAWRRACRKGLSAKIPLVALIHRQIIAVPGVIVTV